MLSTTPQFLRKKSHVHQRKAMALMPGIHVTRKRVWDERQSVELSGWTMQHEEGAKVQGESLRSWRARGGDCKEKTKRPEQTLEKLAE